jgi:outer membrane protein insertion porin family
MYTLRLVSTLFVALVLAVSSFVATDSVIATQAPEAVTELPVIRRIEFRGIRSVSQSELLERLSERDALVFVETRLDLVKAKRAETVIQELLAERAHKLALVQSSYERLAQGQGVRLMFSVDEGPLTP